MASTRFERCLLRNDVNFGELQVVLAVELGELLRRVLSVAEARKLKVRPPS
jgi:hypothetical protein